MAERYLSLKKKNRTTQSTDWFTETLGQITHWKSLGGEEERNESE